MKRIVCCDYIAVARRRTRYPAMTPLSLLFSYFTIGFCTVFPSLAASYIMVNTLDFSASDVATTGLLCSIPWCLKPLWAYISDTFACCGYRRRPYVSVFSLLTAVLLVATPQRASVGFERDFVALLALTSFCLCFVDVAVDGSVMVIVSRETEGVDEGKAQTHSWIARVGGGTLAAGWSGYVYETMGFTSMMAGCAALPLVLSLVALDIPDTPVARLKRLRAERKSACATPREVLRSLLQSRYVLAAAVIVSLVPEINTSLFFYLLSAHATPREMSLVDVSGSMASLVTLLLYNTCRPSHRRSFFAGVVLNAAAALMGCFMADDAVPWLLQGAAFEAALSAVGSALVLMPTITVLGKTAASSEHEATVYSLALSVLNLASVGSESVAAAAMRQLHVTKGDVNNVRVFVGVVAVITLLTAPAAWLFPKKGPHDDAPEEEHELLPRKKYRRRDGRDVNDGKHCKNSVFTIEYASSSDSGSSAAEKETDVGSFSESLPESGESDLDHELTAIPRSLPVV